MKHIKPFNENKINNLEDKVKDFCETNLAYLLDDDSYELEFSDVSNIHGIIFRGLEVISISLCKKIYVARDIMKWEDIKDHLIPFLFILNKEYKVISLQITNRSFGLTHLMNIEDVINDNNVPEIFYQIRIELYEAP